MRWSDIMARQPAPGAVADRLHHGDAQPPRCNGYSCCCE
jgi:hypothetical protein